MPAIILSLVLVLALPAGLGGGKIKVETWRDRAVELESFRTFDWLSTPPGTWSRQQRGIRTLEDGIREQVAKRLAAMGYVQDGENDVDFLITYEFMPPAARRASMPPVRCARFHSQTPLQGLGKSDNYLYLEFRGGESGQPVWRGRAMRVVSGKEDVVEERIAVAVREVLAQFPSAAAGD